MSAQPAIIVFSHDQSLLNTRTWVLEGAGYRIAQVTHLDEFKRAAIDETVRLVVLCHTLTQEEFQTTLAALRQDRPSVKRLLITVNSPLSPHALTEPTISAFDGPRALIDMVRKVLDQAD